MKNRKTKAIVTGVIGTAMTMMMAGCGATNTNAVPSAPNDANCNDWDYDKKTGTYQCDDNNSNYRGHYYYGGSYYGSSSALTSSPSYASGVTSGKVSPSKSNSMSTSKSGFGTGSKGGSFGG